MIFSAPIYNPYNSYNSFNSSYYNPSIYGSNPYTSYNPYNTGMPYMGYPTTGMGNVNPFMLALPGIIIGAVGLLMTFATMSKGKDENCDCSQNQFTNAQQTNANLQNQGFNQVSQGVNFS